MLEFQILADVLFVESSSLHFFLSVTVKYDDKNAYHKEIIILGNSFTQQKITNSSTSPAYSSKSQN